MQFFIRVQVRLENLIPADRESGTEIPYAILQKLAGFQNDI